MQYVSETDHAAIHLANGAMILGKLAKCRCHANHIARGDAWPIGWRLPVDLPGIGEDRVLRKRFLCEDG